MKRLALALLLAPIVAACGGTEESSTPASVISATGSSISSSITEPLGTEILVSTSTGISTGETVSGALGLTVSRSDVALTPEDLYVDSVNVSALAPFDVTVRWDSGRPSFSGGDFTAMTDAGTVLRPQMLTTHHDLDSTMPQEGEVRRGVVAYELPPGESITKISFVRDAFAQATWVA